MTTISLLWLTEAAASRKTAARETRELLYEPGATLW